MQICPECRGAKRVICFGKETTCASCSGTGEVPDGFDPIKASIYHEVNRRMRLESEGLWDR